MNKNAIEAEILDREPETEEPKFKLIVNIPSKITQGKDEMNFAEFPLSSLSERNDPSQKTIVFEDRIHDRSQNKWIPRRLTITGSDAHGLPTPADEEVLLALIQLSKLQHFASKRVYFTRYQLINLLRWKPTGDKYIRLEQALNRWMGVTMFYKNAWRDKKDKVWADESFHVLERVKIFKNDKNQVKNDESVSYFEWNDVVFKSFQNGNVKALNYDFFLGLKSSVAQRLYRFLDKRFFFGGEKRFDLKTLCHEKIGLSKNSPLADLKRKLNSAIDELEAKCYLLPTPKEARYVKNGPGAWDVVFRRKPTEGALAIDLSATKTTSLEEALVEVGVREQKAHELVANFPRELIDEKLELVLKMKEKKDARVSQNPAGFLISSIEHNYELPKSYKDEVELKERQIKSVAVTKAHAEKERVRELREEEQEVAKRRSIDEYWNSLTSEEKDRIENEALADAEASKLKLIRTGGKVGEAAKRLVLDAFISEVLANG